MPHAEEAPQRAPTLMELFTGFASCGLMGFGGVLPWARRMMVEHKRWLTPQEFNELFSFSQFLPGPNIVNLSVVFGSRMAGPAGAAAALLGVLGPPAVIVSFLGFLYFHYGDLPVLARVLAAIAAAAAGLIIATIAKMAQPLFARRLHWAPLIAVLTFVAVGPLHLPLQWVLLVLAPVSIALAWFKP